MLVSRRAFLALLTAVPAAAKIYNAHLLNSVEDPVEVEVGEAELQPGTYSTNKTIINGPKSIFELMTSGDGGEGMMVRESGSILLSWSQHQLSIFRWVAVPGSEIWVPEGSFVKLLFTPRKNLQVADKGQQFAPWILYNQGLVSRRQNELSAEEES